MFFKKSIFWLFLLFGGPPLLIGQINHQAEFSADYSISEEILDNGSTYSRIILPEVNNHGKLGYPNLPLKFYRFIIPFNQTIEEIIVNPQNKEKMKLNSVVEPVQPPIITSIDYTQSDFIEPVDSIYYLARVHPTEIVTIVDEGYFRGNKIITVAVYPFQYLPTENELDFYSLINLTLKLKNSETKKEINLKNIEDSDNYEKLLNDLVDNKEDIDKYNIYSNENLKLYFRNLQKTKTNNIANEKSLNVSARYIIVTSSELATEFNEFIYWKRRKCIDIELVKIEDILSNYSGDLISGIYDDAGKLRQFLSDAYNNGTRYVLLAGDYSVVPIRYGWNRENVDDINNIIPTDLYFSEFDGDWDVDGDNRYGEDDEDAPDFFSDILVGRLLCKTKNDVRNWVSKILLYERNPGKGNFSYLKEGLYVQSDYHQKYNHAESVSNTFSPLIDNYTIYNEIYNGIPDYDSDEIPDFPHGVNVIEEINNNYGVIFFFSHGGPNMIGVSSKGYNEYCFGCKYSIQCNDLFDQNPNNVYSVVPEEKNGLDNLTNLNSPGIIFTTSCETMPFDDSGGAPSYKNMGESFTVSNESGATHYIGNTRYGYADHNYIQSLYFANTFTLGISNRVSEAYNRSKIMLDSDLDGNYIRYSNNLIGCPDTEIWTEIPSVFNNVQIQKNGSNLSVNANVPGYGTNICVIDALNNGRDYYHTERNISSYVFENVPEDYSVTITRYNYIPFMKNPENIYIQNESFSDDRTIYSNNLFIGSDVTTSKPQGPVVFNSNSEMSFEITGELTIQDDFEAQSGSELTIIKN